jgi:hypothetical protein
VQIFCLDCRSPCCLLAAAVEIGKDFEKTIDKSMGMPAELDGGGVVGTLDPAELALAEGYGDDDDADYGAGEEGDGGWGDASFGTGPPAGGCSGARFQLLASCGLLVPLNCASQCRHL